MRAQTTLIGFPAGTLDDAQRRYDVRIDETPGFAPLRDAVLLPDFDPLYDRDGCRIEVTRRVNVPADIASLFATERDEAQSTATEPKRVVIPDGLDVVEETVVFIGAVWPHYGHFIIDGMSKLWALDRIPDLPILLQARPEVREHGCSYIHEIYARLGFGERTIVSPTRPTLFRKVLAAKAAFQHTFRAFDCHRDPHLKVASSILQERGGPAKVYLTRSKLKPHERKVKEELEIEHRLRNEGFEIIAPETMSFADQVRMFDSARWVVGTIGSAFHTCLFAPTDPDRTLFMISWDKINARYLMIDEITAQRSYYLNAMSVKSIDLRERVTETSMDVERIMVALDEVGALR